MLQLCLYSDPLGAAQHSREGMKPLLLVNPMNEQSSAQQAIDTGLDRAGNWLIRLLAGRDPLQFVHPRQELGHGLI